MSDRALHGLWKAQRELKKESLKLQALCKEVQELLDEYEQRRIALDEKYLRKIKAKGKLISEIGKETLSDIEGINGELDQAGKAMEALRHENEVYTKVTIPTLEKEGSRRQSYYEAEIAIEGYRKGEATPRRDVE